MKLSTKKVRQFLQCDSLSDEEAEEIVMLLKSLVQSLLDSDTPDS